ncbi:MAG: MMPL family transporter, partial [Fimbriimonadaceae bacterium]|nr:MMPL family transporter [Alphaproteobacteria bacterium]
MTSSMIDHSKKPDTTPDYADILVEWANAYRVWIIIICGALLLVSIAGALRSGFNTDARAYFGQDNPDRIAIEAMEARHGRYDTAVLLLAPKNGSIFSATTLTALAAATKQVRSVVDVFAVQSLANLESLGNVAGWAPRQILIDPNQPVGEDTVLLAQKVTEEAPTQVKTLVSNQGHVAAINMLIRTHDGAPELELATVEQLRALKSAFSAEYPAIEFHLTGSAVLNATFMDAIRNDMFFLVPFQVIAIVGLLLICLQSVLVAGVLLLVLGLTCAMTMGIAGWLGHDLNGVTSATPM